ncbi:MAG: glycosyltransferase [Planctomycetes bacterium]|nr:glycosyltransferase [Planctomycetota bacterium]MCB9904892.1 glycosyltransferase [Planctomycetota bacterium]
MRLLLVSHRYPPDHSAGTELYTAQLAAGLVRRGHEVRVFTAEKDISAPDLCVREREHEGVRVFELVNNLHYDDPRQSWELPGAANAFACVVDEWKPDLIHFQHLLHLSVGCAEVARKSGAGVVMTLHDYWLQCARFGQRVHVEGTVCHEIDRARCAQCLSHFKYAQTPTEQRLAGWISGLKRKTGIDLGPAARGAGRALSRKADGDAADPDPRAEALWTERLAEREHDFRTRLLPSVDRFLSPSAFLRERFVEWGMSPDHIEHLPTGVDLDAFGRLPREPRGAEVRVAFLGSMIPAKGPDVLLEAWGRLTPEQRSRARLDLFGPAAQPEYGKRLEALARACGAHLHGPLRRDAVAAQLARTDLLVVPSVWFENAPLVILEALAARTPLLVSHLGGMAELVHAGEHGLHFAPGDALDLARVLGEAIDDPSHLDAFYRAGEFPPTLDEMHDAVLAVYERVLGERAAR